MAAGAAGPVRCQRGTGAFRGNFLKIFLGKTDLVRRDVSGWGRSPAPTTRLRLHPQGAAGPTVAEWNKPKRWFYAEKAAGDGLGVGVSPARHRIPGHPRDVPACATGMLSTGYGGRCPHAVPAGRVPLRPVAAVTLTWQAAAISGELHHSGAGASQPGVAAATPSPRASRATGSASVTAGAMGTLWGGGKPSPALPGVLKPGCARPRAPVLPGSTGRLL